MHKFIKMFHENKLNILKIVAITVFILIIIQVLNSIYEHRQLQIYEQSKDDIDSSNNTTIDNSDYLINKKQTVKKSDDRNVKETMDRFVVTVI